MKKLKMARGVTLTFEEGCNKYLENCRQRNLREGTIGHYRQSYIYFYKFFDPKMPIEDIDEQTYKDYAKADGASYKAELQKKQIAAIRRCGACIHRSSCRYDLRKSFEKSGDICPSYRPN